MPKLELIKVFLASPGDLSEERKLFPNVIKQVNDIKARKMNYHLEAVGWEDALPGAGRPQEIINDDVKECDVFVMLLWKRWGTPPSEWFSSGTEEEFNIAYNRYKTTGLPHILLYFRSVPQAMMADPGEQLRRVIEFRTKIEVERNFLYKVYDKPRQWREFLVAHLSKWLDKLVTDESNTLSELRPIKVPDEMEERIVALQKELEEKNAQLKTTQSKLRAAAVKYAVEATKLMKEGKLTLADEKFAKAVELYGEPEVLNGYALFLRKIGSLDRAEGLYARVLSMSSEKTGIYQAIALNGIGTIWATRGNLDEAERMYEKSAEKMHEKSLGFDNSLERDKGLAIAHVNLGNVYMSKGDFDKAEKMYKNAIEINKTLGRMKGLATVCVNLGNLYMARSDPNKAKEMYKEALEINKTIGRTEGVANAYVGLGAVHMMEGSLDEAQLMYEQALQINKLLGRKKELASIFINLGIISKRNGILTEARSLWLQAIHIYEGFGNNHHAEQIRSWMDQSEPIVIEFLDTSDADYDTTLDDTFNDTFLDIDE